MKKITYVLFILLTATGIVWCGTYEVYTKSGWAVERVSPPAGPISAAEVPRYDIDEGYNIWDDIMSDGLQNSVFGDTPIPWHKLYLRDDAHWISWQSDGRDIYWGTHYYWYYSYKFPIYSTVSRATLWFSCDDDVILVRLRNYETGASWIKFIMKSGYTRLHRVDLTDFFRLHDDGETYQMELYVRNVYGFHTGFIAYMSYDYGTEQDYSYQLPMPMCHPCRYWATISMPFFPSEPGITISDIFTYADEARYYDWSIGDFVDIDIDAPLTGTVGDIVRTYTIQVHTDPFYEDWPNIVSGYPIYEQRYLDIDNNNHLWFGTVNCDVPFSGTNPDDYPDGKILGTATMEYRHADGGGWSPTTTTVQPRYGYDATPQVFANSLPYHLDVCCGGGLMASEEEFGEPAYFGHTEEELAELEEISSIVLDAPDTAEILEYVLELGRRALIPGKPIPEISMPDFHKKAYQQSAIPSDFSISVYPTPFNSTVTIAMSVPEDGNMAIEVYDVSGKLVCNLFNDEITAGQWNFKWNGTDDDGINMPGGIYFIKASCSSYNVSAKVVLVK